MITMTHNSAKYAVVLLFDLFVLKYDITIIELFFYTLSMFRNPIKKSIRKKPAVIKKKSSRMFTNNGCSCHLMNDKTKKDFIIL
jgi:hypothetical protein